MDTVITGMEVIPAITTAQCLCLPHIPAIRRVGVHRVCSLRREEADRRRHRSFHRGPCLRPRPGLCQRAEECAAAVGDADIG